MENKFKDNLKNLRIASNISQRDFAKIMNVSYKTISHWENGYSEPSIEMLIKIKKYFEISYEDLIE